MVNAGAEAFLGRVLERLSGMSRNGFSSDSWQFENRPTSEGVGLKAGVDLDVDKVAARILDVTAYPQNIKYVENCTIIDRISDTEQLYVQKMKLPALGGIQVALHMQDLGERDGYRVVAWNQDDAATENLDKRNGGARTAYNLGAWLIKPDELAYALSAAPLKKDVGSIKYTLMTKGSDATASTVLSSNIDAMIGWAHRD